MLFVTVYHLWQSLALNDLFLLNYGLQGLNALLLKGNVVDERNYYEVFIAITEYYPLIRLLSMGSFLIL